MVWIFLLFANNVIAKSRLVICLRGFLQNSTLYMKMYILYRHAEANSYTVCSTVTGFLISEAIVRFVPLVKDLNFVN